jgi:hypothetical protein
MRPRRVFGFFVGTDLEFAMDSNKWLRRTLCQGAWAVAHSMLIIAYTIVPTKNQKTRKVGLAIRRQLRRNRPF